MQQDKTIRQNRNRKRIFAILVTAGLFLCFFLLNDLTPALADDFYYLRMAREEAANHTFHLSGLLKTLVNYYQHWGGRLVGILFTKILAYIPTSVQNLANTCAYFLAVWLIYRIIAGHLKMAGGG